MWAWFGGYMRGWMDGWLIWARVSTPACPCFPSFHLPSFTAGLAGWLGCRRDALPIRVGAIHCGDTGGLGDVVGVGGRVWVWVPVHLLPGRTECWQAAACPGGHSRISPPCRQEAGQGRHGLQGRELAHTVGRPPPNALPLPCLWCVQVLRAGRLLILSVPGELTTMAGRRLKRAVQAAVGFPVLWCAGVVWCGVVCCAGHPSASWLAAWAEHSACLPFERPLATRPPCHPLPDCCPPARRARRWGMPGAAACTS